MLLIEIISFIATVILSVLWIKSPSGNYEPWTVLCGLTSGGIELYRRIKNASNYEVKPLSEEEKLSKWLENQGFDKPLSQVLPRVIQLAKICNNKSLEHWAKLELNGYFPDQGQKNEDVVPKYREIAGRYIDDYDRILQIDDPRLSFINTYRLRYGVKILEELSCKTDMQNIQDIDINHLIRRYLKVDVYRFCFNPIEIVGVLDLIRNTLMKKLNEKTNVPQA